MDLFAVFLKRVGGSENLVSVRETFKECQLSIDEIIKGEKKVDYSNYNLFRFTIERLI